MIQLENTKNHYYNPPDVVGRVFRQRQIIFEPPNSLLRGIFRLRALSFSVPTQSSSFKICFQPFTQQRRLEFQSRNDHFKFNFFAYLILQQKLYTSTKFEFVRSLTQLHDVLRKSNVILVNTLSPSSTHIFNPSPVLSSKDTFSSIPLPRKWS